MARRFCSSRYGERTIQEPSAAAKRWRCWCFGSASVAARLTGPNPRVGDTKKSPITSCHNFIESEAQVDGGLSKPTCYQERMASLWGLRDSFGDIQTAPSVMRSTDCTAGPSAVPKGQGSLSPTG